MPILVPTVLNQKDAAARFYGPLVTHSEVDDQILIYTGSFYCQPLGDSQHDIRRFDGSGS